MFFNFCRKNIKNVFYNVMVRLFASAPVDYIECHQNTTLHGASFNNASSSASSSWLQQTQSQQLVFVESVASTVVCVVHGGYPPPSETVQPFVWIDSFTTGTYT